jgi:hypothetical protein
MLGTRDKGPSLSDGFEAGLSHLNSPFTSLIGNRGEQLDGSPIKLMGSAQAS